MADQKTTELEAGQVWLPSNMLSDAAPRKIEPFIDATGAPWVNWHFPGYPSTGSVVPVKNFRAWIRRTQAKLVGATNA